MAWFRRLRSSETRPATADDTPTDASLLPVPVATAPALARTERALQMLAAQSSQLHTCIVQLEHRVDRLSETMLDQLDRPSFDDLISARMHSAKVASELSRLEINIAARLESVRAEIRALRGDDAPEIDLRELAPTDTGWSISA